MSEWQPIETAPTDPDETFVAILWDGTVFVGLRIGSGPWIDAHCFESKPTHWMPLPVPPISKAK